MCNYKDMAKQKLSKEAAAAKKARDIKYAKTPKRRKRKRENQAIGQNSNSDLHLSSDGSITRVPVAYNRDTFGRGDRRRRRGRRKRDIT